MHLVASGQSGPRNLTSDSGSLYWVTIDGSIMKVASNGDVTIKKIHK
jgi:hypothetical protein